MGMTIYCVRASFLIYDFSTPSLPNLVPTVFLQKYQGRRDPFVPECLLPDLSPWLITTKHADRATRISTYSSALVLTNIGSR